MPGIPKVRLSFLWHMHQPTYRDPETGAFLMPWVRLHAARAYNDMAFLLERHPDVRCTVNFTPVLLEQIDAAASGEALDRFEEVSRKPPRDLSPEERQSILRSFFMVDWETSIKPLPRYWELLQKRGVEIRFLDLARVARTFADEELGDLQVLFNLAWLGFAALEEDPDLAAIARKGRGFSRGDCDHVLRAHRRCLAQVVPRWRKLAQSGQVELSSTPYFHPILPLLCDSDSARRALPALPLPPRFAWPEDARWQVREAMASHAARFGAPPRGMWPAEGSVSPEALEVLAGEGLVWAASDEGVLFHSLPPETRRTHSLYRPWRVAAGPGELAMLFRDRGLSDLIGFTYSRTGAAEAVADFMGHLEAIGEAWAAEGRPGQPTVSVILDGENPWEHFPGSGREFLEGLYRALEASPAVRTVTASEAAAGAEGPAIPKIHSGSWIESSFRIWMGHEEDRRAWAALGKARQALARAEAERAVPPEALERARRLLAAAEGSDWFWWYGDDFQTELALEFDALFRSLVRKACELLGAPVPSEALGPIKRVGLTAGAEAGPVREPTLLLTPSIDGRETNYFEWQGAGLYRPAQLRGSMFGSAQAFRALHFGFDLSAFHLRLDPAESPQRTSQACSAVRVEVRVDGREERVEFEVVPDGVARPGRARGAALGSAAFAKVVELSIPFEPLALERGASLAVAVHALRGEVEVERLPRTGYLTFAVPDEDFERAHWRV
jgi:alpha-amylase/alpha-mannosidase (GH57 family)